MESLVTIQKISKAGKIISKISYFCCLIGGMCSAIGIICLYFGILKDPVVLNGLTIKGFIEQEAQMTVAQMYAAMASTIVLCGGQGYVSYKTCQYFTNELKVGTPFTYQGADELKRVGILSIVVPVVSSIVVAIMIGVVSSLYESLESFSMKESVNIGWGLVLIVISVICRYGAYVQEKVN